MAVSQPAILRPAHGRYGQDSENGPAARRAHGTPRRARARGSRRGHIVACSRARARQQIKISQNSGTLVPKRGENGWESHGTTARAPADRFFTEFGHQNCRFAAKMATRTVHWGICHSTHFPADFRPTAQTQQPTVDHALYARTSTARTTHKMYEAPYILPYMTGNFRPTAQTQKPTVCLNFRPQYKSIVYFRTKVR